MIRDITDLNLARELGVTYISYETIVIYNPYTYYPSATKLATEVIPNLGRGTYVDVVDNIGIKNLAYTLQGFDKGYYVSYLWKTRDKNDLYKLEKVLRADDNVLKYITVSPSLDN